MPGKGKNHISDSEESSEEGGDEVLIVGGGDDFGNYDEGQFQEKKEERKRTDDMQMIRKYLITLLSDLMLIGRVYYRHPLPAANHTQMHRECAGDPRGPRL